MLKRIIISLMFLVGCGTQTTTEDRRTQNDPNQTAIKQLQDQILALQGTQAQISSLVNSDFMTCPLSGNTANPIINNMCKVAQYATNETRVQFEGELAAYSNQLNTEIANVNDSLATAISQEATDVTTLNASIAAINTQVTTINSNITTLQTQMTSANSAITALQTQVNGAVAVLNGALTTVDIGVENLAAGPLYETVLRATDSSKINAYVEAYGTSTAISNNSLTATNGSSSIKLTQTAHGLVVGDTINVSGLSGSKGFTNADVNGFIVVASVVDANNVTFNSTHTATSSGVFGGSAGFYAKLLGRGLGTVWVTANGADAAVRKTTLGTPYNFIVKATGQICYDKTVAAQTFAVINAGGGNIVCK